MLWRSDSVGLAHREKMNGGPIAIVPVMLPGANLNNMPGTFRNLHVVDSRSGLDDPQELAALMAAIEPNDESGELARVQRIGDELRASGDPQRAAQLYERALAIARASGDASDPGMQPVSFQMRTDRERELFSGRL